MYQRVLKSQIKHWLKTDMVLIIYGARQVGKTTLTREIASEYDENYYYVDCEDFGYQEILNSGSIETLKRFVGNAKLVLFDEAQKVQQIGVALKLIHDHIPNVKVIATGSSSFELANKVSEPLTGRNIKFQLYPLSMSELSQTENMFKLSTQIHDMLRFGTYPNVVKKGASDAQTLLKTLSNDYLYRDAIELGDVRKPIVFKNLVRTLAYLIGQTVNYSDIAKKVGTDRDTVERYIDILEKSFIIKVLRPLHRSHVREIIHPFKVYFYDLGIRNSLVDDFKPLSQREDKEVGALWENFCIIERVKKNEYGNPQTHTITPKQYYFWRTKESSPKEYDLVEESDNHLDVFEMKWSGKKEDSVKKYEAFFEAYPDSELNVIHSQNWWDWLL
jgi:uncharacterized protein